ncbi:MAG: allantoate amidohydrolase [Novosphingobium sp.]
MVTGGVRAVARCKTLGVAPFSDMAGGLYRGYLSSAHRSALDQVGRWMVEAGMSAEVDPAGNLVGYYAGTDKDPPSLIIGSHLDSVRDAGVFDGPLGIMLGIECVAALHERGERMPFAIEIYGFGDEEGSRFPAAMLTSRAVAGSLDADLVTIVDGEGVSLPDALQRFNADYREICTGLAILPREQLGLGGFHKARRQPAKTLAYLEAHIEQGPVLEAEGLAVGTVTGIAAQLRFEIGLSGTAGHAGTTAMGLRRDAVAGMAEMVLAAEEVATAGPPDLVATVGVVEVPAGAANVIAGRSRFTLDVRAGDAVVRDRAAEDILRHFREIAERRDLGLSVRQGHDLPPSPCDPALMAMLDEATRAAGHRPFRLVSGAGHDAMIMAALCPTAMLFLRCRGGVSHNPAEHVEPADAEAALAVMSGFITRLGASRAA